MDVREFLSPDHLHSVRSQAQEWLEQTKDKPWSTEQRSLALAIFISAFEADAFKVGADG